MKNQKRNIRVINKFPEVLVQLKSDFLHKNSDCILDASYYPFATSLFKIAMPDIVLLNVNLRSSAIIDIAAADMQDCYEIKIGMITTNPHAYYVSLCNTLTTHYYVNREFDLEFAPGQISFQQLN